MKLKSLILAAALSLAGPAMALSADLAKAPPLPPPWPAVVSWSGLTPYFEVGGDWDQFSLSSALAAGSSNPSSVLFGGGLDLLYELKSLPVVWGARFDLRYANPGLAGGTSANYWRGSAGPMVGLAINQANLLYVWGGLAAENAKIAGLVQDPAYGWTVGGGWKWKPFGNAFTTDIGVDYLDLDGFQSGPLTTKNTAVEAKLRLGWEIQ